MRDGDVDKVRRHLAATTADANELDEEGRTALHWLVATAGTSMNEEAAVQGSAAGGASTVEGAARYGHDTRNKAALGGR